jgi:hypothetical protein
MSDNILHKYTARVGGTGDADDTSDADGSTEDLGAFGWLRSPRDRCNMLELRKRCGNVLAIPYNFISAILFDPSDGITIRCEELNILIKGRNLNGEVRPQTRLFQGLCRHRCPWVAEVGTTDQLRLPADAVVIQSIEW